MPFNYGRSGGKRFVRYGRQKKHYYTSVTGRARARRLAGKDAQRIHAAVAMKGGRVR
jgi:hypothetical protein